MIINQNSLLEATPIKNMETSKRKYEGTSYGLSEAGYDIRIKQEIIFHRIEGRKFVSINGNLQFGHFCLASAIEEFQMPNNLVGVVHDKSSWARKGLSVFNTVIEPGWKGFLTLELVFHGNKKIVIKPGQGIAQVLFRRISDEADYGNGKYQNQANHPVESIPTDN